ncbi:MAG: DUF177 domain-containing protein [Arenibacterium sp.]
MSLPSGFRVADLDHNAPTPFDLKPDAATCASLAETLGINGVRKLRFSGQITAQGRRDWRLDGQLGATVVQPCVVTLDPVTTRIDVAVTRSYLAGYIAPEEAEAEMPEDDTLEALGEVIDPAAVMAEALALALPDYPRKKDVELGDAVFTEAGAAPISDEDVKPFAGLAALRDKMRDTE